MTLFGKRLITKNVILRDIINLMRKKLCYGIKNILHFSLLQPSDDETTNFYVSLCFDVLLELLQFGERRGLAKLERIGRRFHQSVENFFAVMPFLRLDLQIRPRFLFIIFRHKCFA